MEDNKWDGYVDELGLVRAYKGKHDGNTIVWSAYADLSGALKYSRARMIQLYGVHAKNDGTFRQDRFQPDWERLASHDNLTSLIYFASKCNLLNTFIQRVDVTPYKHPRDWAFLGILKSRKSITATLMKPLYYLVYSLVIIHTCMRDYTSKNGQRDTDGKLLYLLRKEVIPIPFVDKICVRFLRKNWGEDYLAELLSNLWYHDKNHPIRLHMGK